MFIYFKFVSRKRDNYRNKYGALRKNVLEIYSEKLNK